MNDKKFEDECLKDKEIVRKAGVKLIEDDRTRDILFKGSLGNSDYFLKGAEIISKSEVPYLSITLGFFSMEQRANALALISDNYQILNHECVQIYLSKIFGRKDLAKLLSDAWNLRLTYNYRMDLKTKSDINDVDNFMNKLLKPFILEVDKIIAEIK